MACSECTLAGGGPNTFNLRLHRCKIAAWPELGSRRRVTGAGLGDRITVGVLAKAFPRQAVEEASAGSAPSPGPQPEAPGSGAPHSHPASTAAAAKRHHAARLAVTVAACHRVQPAPSWACSKPGPRLQPRRARRDRAQAGTRAARPHRGRAFPRRLRRTGHETNPGAPPSSSPRPSGWPGHASHAPRSPARGGRPAHGKSGTGRSAPASRSAATAPSQDRRSPYTTRHTPTARTEPQPAPKRGKGCGTHFHESVTRQRYLSSYSRKPWSGARRLHRQ